jgi:hypothetical protein
MKTLDCNSDSPERGYTKRYEAFLKLGGGKNHEYMKFISDMKREYMEIGFEKGKSIRDHNLFTDFIEGWVDAEISYREGKTQFAIRFKNEKA